MNATMPGSFPSRETFEAIAAAAAHLRDALQVAISAQDTDLVFALMPALGRIGYLADHAAQQLGAAATLGGAPDWFFDADLREAVAAQRQAHARHP